MHPIDVNVFVSYSTKDRHWVEKLVADLGAREVKVWYDRLEILPGKNIFDKVYSAIRNSDVLAVVLTRNAVQSQWVKEETEVAKLQQFERKDITIIPLLFEDCEIPSHLKVFN